MKKILAFAGFGRVSMGSFCSGHHSEEKYSIATNSFFSNWFAGWLVDWNPWYSAEEEVMICRSSFEVRSNPGISPGFR